MAISCRAATVPSLKLSNSTSPSPPSSVSFKPTSRRPLSWEKTHVTDLAIRVSAYGNLGSLRGGAGVLERPTFDQSQFDPIPEAEEGGDIGRLRDKKGLGRGDSYRVLLIDDVRHTEKLVEKALPQVVPSVTPSDARKLFNQSRERGVAVVIVTVKEHAEFYAQMMIRWGLRSGIEPDSNMA